ncbi:GTP-binding protein [Alginatibacterium sediminis]|uniref:GTP-binding protein n=1 Tax=Alginatibacterium sediminis TaxID=2164068 RepID=A0A420EH95_9ALTE|nr:GTPase [Alginatibacterium sediminis]RKF20053.1 GTP-binding protein [Alginatibacterium sediminis]
MIRLRKFFQLLYLLSGGRWGILLISSLLPACILMGYGLVLSFKHGYLLQLSLVIALSTLIITIPLYVLGRKSEATKVHVLGSGIKTEDSLVKASEDWSDAELSVWNESKLQVRQLAQTQVFWTEIDQLALEVLRQVAQHFGKKPLEFTLPEGLALFEEISERYRHVIEQHLPGADLIKLSYLKTSFDVYDKYGDLGHKLFKVALWANHTKNLFYNPFKVVSDLSKEQATAAMTKGLVDEIQRNAKTAFLDEVAAVAIDLYSGRFNLPETIPRSDISFKDEKRGAAALEPFRIVFVGQTGGGKSSLVNLITGEWLAEIDSLPTSRNACSYQVNIDDKQLCLLDLKGLDGSKGSEDNALLDIIHADLVVWVLKADQAARELDQSLLTKFNEYFNLSINISRKKPKIIVVVNQVDRLQPQAVWNPPYGIEEPCSDKAESITQAVQYNAQLFCPDIILPLSIAPNKVHFGYDEFKQVLVEQFQSAANIQRNRQRHDAQAKAVTFKTQLKKVGKASRRLVSRLRNG